MMKKYEITDETIRSKNGTGKGIVLHRIRALNHFGNVTKGDFGGWIQEEYNLSHEGNCWVADEAIVCGNAKVFQYVRIYG